MSYILFLDDTRNPEGISSSEDIILCRSVSEANEAIQNRGFPNTMYLDHDLGIQNGKESDVREFLTGLLSDKNPIDWPMCPYWYILSSNPVGRKWIYDFMTDWERHTHMRRD